MIVFSFTGREGLERWMQRADELLRRYSGAEGLETSLVT